MTIRIDLNERVGLSKSGRTMIIASTGGNLRLEDTKKLAKQGVYLGLNCYTFKGGVNKRRKQYTPVEKSVEVDMGDEAMQSLVHEAGF